MKLDKIVNTSTRGIYVAAKLDNQSLDKIQDFAKKLGIPNIIEKDAMHTTIIFSRKDAPDLKVDNTKYPINANGKKLHIFKTQGGENSLVLLLDCPGLVDRHNMLMSEYQTTYDHDEYQPHISLSYKSLEFDPDVYNGAMPSSLVFINEYSEPLDLTFAAKHS